jgi:hypothetical protein
MVKNRRTFFYYKGRHLFLATGVAVRDGLPGTETLTPDGKIYYTYGL